ELQNELKKAKNEVTQLKDDMKVGQEKIRGYYKDLEENLETLAEEKSLKKLKQSDIVKRYESLIEKYNGLVNKHNGHLKELRDLTQKVQGLTFQNRFYKNHIQELKEENGNLKEKLSLISKEFAVFKERVAEVLHAQIDRIKTFLRI